MKNTYNNSAKPVKGSQSTGTPVKKPRYMRRSAKAVFTFLAMFSAIALCDYFFGHGTASGVTLGLLVALPEGQLRSGKSGTVVWKRNGQMRVNFIPRLVRNSFTTAIRATLSSFSSAWNSLSQANQNGWLSASGFTTTDRLGKTVILKGKTLFVQLNTNLDTLGSSPISVCPSVKSVPAPLTSGTPTADVSSTAIDLLLSNANTDFGITVEATGAVSAGTNSPGRNKFRSFYASDDSTAIVSTDVWTAYAARFGARSAGQIFFIRFSYIHQQSGQMGGVSQSYKVVVTA